MNARFVCRLIAFIVVLGGLSFLSSGSASADENVPTRMLSQPAISQTSIAFVYDGDLWIANRDGTNPHRLTSHEGDEVSPRFSPDGKSIAFSAQYDGNRDVYIMPVSGGSPRRLTFHPGNDSVEGFTPDGSAVLFSSSRNGFTRRYRKLFTVPVDGGFPSELPIPNGLRASYSSDGKKIAYIPIGERFTQWKNYRGGTCSRIWIYDTGNHSVVQIAQPEGRCNDTDPVYVGSKVYFRSDRNGEFNLFSYNPANGEIKQLTQFDDFPVNRLTESADSVIFEQAGVLHLFDPANGSSNPIDIRIATDATELRPRFVSDKRWIRGVGISPSAKRAVVEYRGEIVTVPAKKGDFRNLTQSTGAHDRSPAWSPDGKQIAFFSDASGEYKLNIVAQDGKGDVQVFDLEGHGFFEDPKWSPDNSKISYRDNSWSLYVFDIAKKKSTKICSEPRFGPTVLRGLSHQWSPDSKWIAYTVNTDAMIQQAFVYNVSDQSSHAISDGMSEVREPVFDRSGKYLYFLSSIDAGPIKHWFAMSNNDMEVSSEVYLVVLKEDGDNPLVRENDEEESKDEASGDSDEEKSDEKKSDEESKGGEKETDKKMGDKKKTPNDVRIDFQELDQRILALPLPNAAYSNLEAGPAGTVLVVKRDRDGERELVSFSMKTRKTTTLMKGVTGFSVTPDGKNLLYAASGSFGIAPSTGKIDAGAGKLDLDSVTVRIDPRAEWKQIFDEVWRVNRDYFYDPGMHGADWVAMKAKYEPFLEHCVTRGDLNRVLVWMCSEIGVGHHRVGGGEERVSVDSVGGGLLGADFEIDNDRYRFKKIYGGLNWNGQLRSPLTEPGVRVKPNEYIIAVNGVDLKSGDNIYRHFENTAGKNVELTVGPNPDGSDSRTVSVVPIANEGTLRNRDWMEGNLRRVTEATQGRVAYVYVPNTAGAGLAYFKRYFYPQTNREAIIVDERFNGGGQVADYYIDHLRRPYISHWATRYGDDFMTPTGSILGPKVMLIDETAGSGGDLLPWMFHKLKLGTLVGRRTWGGLVGILGYPVLMDGGTVTAPNLAIWTEDGFVVENVGVPPDVEVEQLPSEIIAGRDPQLEKAIEIILKQLEANPPKQYKKPPYPIRVRK